MKERHEWLALLTAASCLAFWILVTATAEWDARSWLFPIGWLFGDEMRKARRGGQ